MELTDEQYLVNVLNSKKARLKELHIKHRIDMAVFEETKDRLEKDIYSLEGQLGERFQ